MFSFQLLFELTVEIPVQLHLELEVNLLVHNVIEREIEREKVQMKPPYDTLLDLSRNPALFWSPIILIMFNETELRSTLRFCQLSKYSGDM